MVVNGLAASTKNNKKEKKEGLQLIETHQRWNGWNKFTILKFEIGSIYNCTKLNWLWYVGIFLFNIFLEKAPKHFILNFHPSE